MKRLSADAGNWWGIVVGNCGEFTWWWPEHSADDLWWHKRVIPRLESNWILVNRVQHDSKKQWNNQQYKKYWHFNSVRTLLFPYRIYFLFYLLFWQRNFNGGIYLFDYFLYLADNGKGKSKLNLFVPSGITVNPPESEYSQYYKLKVEKKYRIIRLR